MKKCYSQKYKKDTCIILKQKTNQKVVITSEMKELACKSVYTMHDLMRRHHIPTAEYSKKCDQCSLADICIPEMRKENPDSYINRYIGELL